MRKRALICILALIVWAVSIGAERGTIIPYDNSVDTSYMETMHTTAYYQGHHTATGVPVHPGIAACNTHLGDIAIVYTMDGKYLGTYEVCDTGGTEGLQNGCVLDVWKCNFTQCQTWMKLTGGKVKVQWIKGEG